MVYADPPFNTGRAQTRSTVRVTPDAAGDRTGFGGRRYRTELLERSSYRDSFDDYLGFLEPRLREIHRLLDAEGTLYLHLDQREAHYVKLLLDEVFGRDCVPERAGVGLRLRRQAEAALAGEARHDPGVRARPRPVPVRLRRPSSASRTWRPGS